MKRTMKKIMAVMFVFIFAISAMSANDDIVAKAATNKKVKSISVTNLPAKTVTVKKGKSVKLSVKVTTSGKKVSKAFTAKSGNPKVAAVKVSGTKVVVTGKKNGKADVTITSKANTKKKVKIKVTVGTPVTKVSMKKSASVLAGKQLSIKATVGPKKASNKALIWKSSNTAVATVNSKGTVTAKKAGTATITATAADGSKKKASCKVTVVAPVNIAKVEVLNPVRDITSTLVRVTLSSAKKLGRDSFSVKSSSLGQGVYNRTLGVDYITTSDNKVYMLYLDDSIYEGETVRVTVPALNGTKTKAAKYWEPVTTTSGQSIHYFTYNAKDSISEKFDCSGYPVLTSISGLPKGLTARMERNSLVIKGTPAVKGSYTIKYSIKDERGNIQNNVIYALIGSQNSIAAAAMEKYYLIGSDKIYVSNAVSVEGGSGEYTYSLTGTTYGLKMDGRTVSGNLSNPGTYKVYVKVTDKANANITATVPVIFHVRQGITVSGFLKDAQGVPINSASIAFCNKNASDKYFTKKIVYANSDGTYSITLSPGTYNVGVRKSNGMAYCMNQKFTATKSGVDYKIPVYKISVISSDASLSSFGTWLDVSDDEEKMGSGDILYLRAGSYSLKSVFDDWKYTYTALLNLNVSKSAMVTAKVTKNSNVQGAIHLDTPTEIQVNKTVTFTPSKTGTYYFYNVKEGADTYIYVYDSTGEQLKYKNMYGGDYITCSLTKGETYYFLYNRDYLGNTKSGFVISESAPSY